MDRISNIFSWFGIFLSPVFATGLIAFLLWYNYEISNFVIYIIILFGAICGVLLAKRATKNKSASDFNSEIYSTKDIMSYEEIVEEQKKKKTN